MLDSSASSEIAIDVPGATVDVLVAPDVVVVDVAVNEFDLTVS